MTGAFRAQGGRTPEPPPRSGGSCTPTARCLRRCSPPMPGVDAHSGSGKGGLGRTATRREHTPPDRKHTPEHTHACNTEHRHPDTQTPQGEREGFAGLQSLAASPGYGRPGDGDRLLAEAHHEAAWAGLTGQESSGDFAGAVLGNCSKLVGGWTPHLPDKGCSGEETKPEGKVGAGGEREVVSHSWWIGPLFRPLSRSTSFHGDGLLLAIGAHPSSDHPVVSNLHQPKPPKKKTSRTRSAGGEKKRVG